ncbi:hypothetical protein LAZ67_21001357, partial [Cordylochernes scorpioides]
MDPTRSAQEGMSSYKLPKMALTVYDGKCLEWLGWWSQFKTIHESPVLSEVKKFQYLVQSMRAGTRADRLALQDRFGDKVILTEVYVRQLLKMVINNARKKTLTLESLYDQVESHLRALESLGVTTQQNASFLYPLVETSLPKDLLRIWQRSVLAGYSEDEEELPITIDQRLPRLLQFLKREVKGEQRIEYMREGFGTQIRCSQYRALHLPRQVSMDNRDHGERRNTEEPRASTGEQDFALSGMHVRTAIPKALLATARVLVCPTDAARQKILWRETSNKPMIPYRLNTITYGTSPAPFLALITLIQLAIDEGSQYPRAAEALRKETWKRLGCTDRRTYKITVEENSRTIGMSSNSSDTPLVGLKGNPGHSAAWIQRCLRRCDEQGVLRVGGRLRWAPGIPYHQKYPRLIAIRGTAELTYNTFREYCDQKFEGQRGGVLLERRTGLTKSEREGSVSNLANKLSETPVGEWSTPWSQTIIPFWLCDLDVSKGLGGHLLQGCVICCRYNRTTQHQFMSDLPKERLTPGKPFTVSGVDYEGPIQWKSS